MKKILITGLNSYIGNSFAIKYQACFDIKTISLKGGQAWKKLDFSIYDCVLHVAGIAHTSKNPSLEGSYYKINTDLTFEVAQKAKKEGVGQFIFMSSIIIYGDSAPIGMSKVLDKNTVPKPDDFYGNSKLQAEKKLAILSSNKFKVAIIRPPMIYGENSKGNYPKLIKLAKFAIVFPKIENQRSVLHINNLIDEISNIVISGTQGIFMPQDDEYFCTSKFIKDYRKTLGKKTYLISIFNPFIKALSKKVGIINKLFGNLTYKK